MGIDLPLIWALIILFGVMMYVVMDGFDLGIGLLFVAVRDEAQRDVMMNTVAPVWDGNETWLVLGGAGLLAAFPVAYSTILSALYLPLVVMLVGLVLRGVAFEFRFKASERRRHLWNKSFIAGSILATFCQGVVLGAFLEGFPAEPRADAFWWFAPFPLFVGLGLLIAYAQLGSTWLVMKTDGELHARMRRASARIVIALLAVIAVISVWTPLTHAAIRERWFSLPNFFWFLPVPVLVVACAFAIRRALHRGGNDALPFVLTLVLVFLGYSGLGISLWPNVLPPHVSIWEAAGPPQSLGFALVGALLIIPVILVYTAWSYFVFRGKVQLGTGYH
jgi:cytochrome d ubiquinol oxidase subunit II